MNVTFPDALIALGANLPGPEGPPVETLRAAMRSLAGLCDGPVRRSGLYATPAFPAGSGPDFVNAALAMPWSGTAAELLAALHGVEAQFGRTRDRRWEARILDLDLLALGDAVLPDAAIQAEWQGLSPAEAMTRTPDRLILPHPRLAERAFVLVPLMDVAPDWRHPVTGQSVAEMAAALPPADRAGIRVMGDTAR